MYYTNDERLRRTAQAIAARRRERLRITLRRLQPAEQPGIRPATEKTSPDLALRTAQARALLTTRMRSPAR
jgi:hypothetical protein